ncbi:MAG: hypothetical protein H6553_06745 [Chitinophagales bacterium]|nr:hypothetical protein [Chitinophagales bacterium]
MKYSKTEKEVKSIRVHDSNCIGCKKTGKHMMLSYTDHDSDEIIDLFLNKQQAEDFIIQIKKIQNDNNNGSNKKKKKLKSSYNAEESTKYLS